MSDEKLSLVEAEGKLEASTQTAKEAEANYISMATLDAPDAERQTAYEALTAARQDEKQAKEQVLKAQAEAGDPVGYDTIDLVEAVDRAVNKIRGSLSGFLTSCAAEDLRNIRLSLSKDSLQGGMERFVEYCDLYRKVLHDDRGIALVCHEAEEMSKISAERKNPDLVKGIELLREARKSTVDTQQLAQIDKELAELLEQYDSAIIEETALTISSELPELAEQYRNNPAAFRLRKMAGFKSLMEN